MTAYFVWEVERLAWCVIVGKLGLIWQVRETGVGVRARHCGEFEVGVKVGLG